MFENLTQKELQATLQSIIENDYYVEDFDTKSLVLRDFLYVLHMYNLVYVTTTEKRVLLTPQGEKLLQQMNAMLI